MHGIYSYMPETNHVYGACSVAAVLCVQSVLHVVLLHSLVVCCTFTPQLSKSSSLSSSSLGPLTSNGPNVPVPPDRGVWNFGGMITDRQQNSQLSTVSQLSYCQLCYCQLSYCQLSTVSYHLSYCQLSSCQLSYCQLSTVICLTASCVTVSCVTVSCVTVSCLLSAVHCHPSYCQLSTVIRQLSYCHRCYCQLSYCHLSYCQLCYCQLSTVICLTVSCPLSSVLLSAVCCCTRYTYTERRPFLKKLAHNVNTLLDRTAARSVRTAAWSRQ
jgi:hypothetical protein